MSVATTVFNSVELPSALVIEAHQTALAMRSSTALQAQALLADFIDFDANSQLVQQVCKVIAGNAAQAQRMTA
jgi:hypothetical protein